jgi:DNA repair protein RadC
MSIPMMTPRPTTTPRRTGMIAPWVRLVREVPVSAMPEPQPMRSPRQVYEMVREDMEALEVESFQIIALNAQHCAIGRVEVTRGLVSSTIVHPREVFRAAIALNASAILLLHNHPSGDATPSADDRAVTDQLVAAGRLLDCPVHDHIVVGHRGCFTSFAEAGLM